jgi:hypothetical protein
MPFISSLCWVKKGASKTPTQIRIEKNELKSIIDNSNNDSKKRKKGKQEELIESDQEIEDEEGDQNTDKKYNLDDYDDEEDDLKIENLSSLACFSSNIDDAMLTRNDDGDG